MTPLETARTLQRINDWRRGAHDEQPDPAEFGKAIDSAIQFLHELHRLRVEIEEREQTYEDRA